MNAIQRRLFPLASELERPAEPAMPSADTPPLAITRWPWGMLIMVIAGIVLIGVLLIWWGHPVAAPGAEARPAAAPSSTVLPATQTSGNLSAASAALLDTLTRYNRAETEAATGLSIEPLRPFMDPNGAFAQRRAAQLAERQRRNAPHQTILLRWAVGQVTVEGTTATVVTQETWSNQEVGAVAPEQATVRVTYTLRWDAAIGRWVIVETSQQPI